MTTKTQVLIVGAGPTGLTLAVLLAKFGIDFVVIDRSKAITNLSKAVAVQARTVEVYQDMDIAEEALAQGDTAKGVKLGSGVRSEEN